MKALDILYNKLKKYADSFNTNSENFEEEQFSETAREIIEYNDPNSFPILLQYFDDQDNTEFALEDLANALQGYKLNYVPLLLKNFHILFPHAQEWATELIVVILNSPQYHEQILSNIHTTDSMLLRATLQCIANRTNKHEQIIKEILSIIN